MDWWLIITADGAVHAYRLGDPDDDTRHNLVERANIAHNIPHGWLNQPGWDVQLTDGQPHPSLLARATVHSPVELAAVTAEQIAAHQRAAAEASKADRMDSAERALLAMDATEQDEWLDRRRPNIGGIAGGR